MTSILLWLLFGAMVGGLAKWFMPGRLPGGWMPAIGVGIAGSMIGGVFLGGHPAGLVGSVIVAVILIYVLEQAGAANER
jgi:uncharacterized membrane protein YeaQ/YmgE (transglycosylase-associated protein family)